MQCRLFAAKNRHGYRNNASVLHADFVGCRFRQIDDAAFDVRAAVVDADDNRAAVMLVGYADAGAEWAASCERRSWLSG